MSSHPYPPRKVYQTDEPQGPAPGHTLRRGAARLPADVHTIFPEYYATALQTETLIRDMAPITTSIYGVRHRRDAPVIDGKVVPCPLWFTEMGIAPREFGHRIAEQPSASRRSSWPAAPASSSARASTTSISSRRRAASRDGLRPR